MRVQSCCFFGNDEPDPEKREILIKEIDQYLELIAGDICTDFYVSGISGFGYLAAQRILELRKWRKNISLMLAMPSTLNKKDMTEEQIKIYESLRRRADSVVYMSRSYRPGCEARSYRYIINRSGFAMVYIKEKSGDLYDAMQYAQKVGVLLRNVNINLGFVEDPFVYMKKVYLGTATEEEREKLENMDLEPLGEKITAELDRLAEEYERNENKRVKGKLFTVDKEEIEGGQEEAIGKTYIIDEEKEKEIKKRNTLTF